jgi:hypothetical protein
MSLEPQNVLQLAIEKVPAVSYALAVAGLAAAGAIVVSFLGYGRASVIIISAVFVAMILMFIFARMISDPNPRTTMPGIILLYSVLLFFVIFLSFTVTAFAVGWPPAWAELLGIKNTTVTLVSDHFDKSKFAENTENRINYFKYDDADSVGDASHRIWTRVSDDEFIERMPDGKENQFKIDELINYSGCDGYLIHRLGDNLFQMFLPFKGCSTMSLRFRNNPNSFFATLPTMYDVK